MSHISKYVLLFTLLCLKFSAQTADCKKSETTSGEENYPVITKTCTYKNIQTIVTGTTNYTGRIEYYYTLTFKGNNVPNSAIFNSEQGKLLTRLNESFKAKFQAYKKDPAYNDCFGLRPNFKPQKMNGLGIELDEDNIKFTCVFGLAPMCSGANEATISLKLKDVEKYLKE